MNRWTLRIVLVSSLPFLAFFGVALCSDRMFAFRDAEHFYYPLFKWIDAELRAGRMPHWSPFENTGLPIIADGTSSVFYPGKLVFFLPLDFGLRYKLYIVGHILLAQISTFWLARRWGTSIAGATLAGVAYAYGGNILFQYSNVVFLVGASWLPLAFYASERMLTERRWAWALLFGLVLSLTVLGGDPQTGYHAGLAAAFYALLLWWSERRTERSSSKPTGKDDVPQPLPRAWWRYEWHRHRLVLLAVAAGVGFALSAIQILPVSQWASNSSRGVAGPKPITIYAALLSNWTDARDGLLGTPAEGTHRRHIYEFSVGPWRLLEFVWPNITGRPFPIHRRWIEILPGEDRVWVPSNYLGLLPLLCGCAALCVRKGETKQRWLTWLLIATTVGALGWYGVGWLLNEVQFWFTGDAKQSLGLGSPVGGLYWLMVTLLPGYTNFRYPAKLLVMGALALSLLAARGFDSTLETSSRRMNRALIVLGVISLIAGIAVFLVWPSWQLWEQQLKTTALHQSLYQFGPLQGKLANLDIIAAFLQTGLLCFGFRWLLQGITSTNREQRAFVLLGVTCLEIIMANAWMVATAPESVVRTPPQLRTLITADHERQSPLSKESPEGPSPGTAVPELIRTYGSNILWTPSDWWISSSPNRLVDTCAWEHDTLFPRHQILWSLGAVESQSSISSLDYEMYATACRHWFRDANGQEDHQKIATWMGAHYVVLPPETPCANATLVPIPSDSWIHKDVKLWRNNAPVPRAWIVHDIEKMPSLGRTTTIGLAHRTDDALFPKGKVRDLRKSAVIETDDPVILPMVSAAESTALAKDSIESCKIIAETRHKIEIATRLKRPGLLVFHDLFFPEWRAFVRSGNETAGREVPILRTNRIMRGVVLPAGEHQVVFEYYPSSFYLGAAISGVAWAALLGVAVLIRFRKKPAV